MNNQTSFRIVGATAVLMALGSVCSQAGLFSAADATRNQAVAVSPRAIEDFPALSRSSVQRVTVAAGKVGQRGTSMSSACAASPRVLEDFVELSRTTLPAPEKSVASSLRTVWGVPLASNPRALEENPALARQPVTATTVPTFQIAPLK